MQKLKFLIPFALFLGAFFVACHEEDPFPSEKYVAVAFAGQIVDENGDPVPDALVKAGSESALTDKNGIFRLDEVDLPANHAILSVTSPGYFEFSRAYVVKDHALQTVTIQLLNKNIAAAIDADLGGLVQIANGPKLNFPANAISDENGNAYHGTVWVMAKYLDPKSPDLGLFMPGNLTGLNLNGERQSLSTFGMIGVELQSPSGQKLKIAGNSEVEIRMPIDGSIASSAPSEIPLWHFDLEKAYWMEEGVAQKIGNEYVGKVKHFSYWNYDGAAPSINIYGIVYLEDTNHPLSGVEVAIRPTDPSAGWGCGHGNTDTDGSFGGAVSKDLQLTLTIYYWEKDCGVIELYTTQIGPFASDATLPPIILPNNNTLKTIEVSGRLVNCNNQPLANGYAKIAVGTSTHFAFANTDGTFASTQILCNAAPQSGQVVGYDIANLLESAPIAMVFPPDVINVGDVSVCTVLSEYIRFTLDANPEVIVVAPFGGLDGTSTFIASEDSLQNNKYILFEFENNAQTGMFPMKRFTVNQFYANLQNSNTLNTTVTEYGVNIGDPIVGTFGGNFKAENGTNHTITGNYRVMRDY